LSRKNQEQEEYQIKQRKPRKPKKQFFELFCEFPGCNKVYKSYVVLNSHIQKRHSGVYIATPNSSHAPIDTSDTPGSPSPRSLNKIFLPNVEAEELFDQDEIDEKDLPWSHYRFKETSKAYSPKKYAKQKEITTNQEFSKKKRGRPRKYPLHSAQMQESLEIVPADHKEENIVDDDIIKMDLDVDVENTQNINESPVKRKRGRPRKYPKQTDQIIDDISDKTLDTAVKENDTGSFIDDNKGIIDRNEQESVLQTINYNDSINNDYKKFDKYLMLMIRLKMVTKYQIIKQVTNHLHT
jgi:hypothetical protein